MNKNSTTFYVYRHGEVDWNAKGLVLGQKDQPLNKKGKMQAKQLAKKIKNINLDVIYASDLIRAEETANILATDRNISVQTSKALREQSFGKYEGMDKDEFIALFDTWYEMTDQERHKFKLSEDVESNESAINRFVNKIKEISIKHNGKAILIVTHGALMRYLLIREGLASYDYLSHFENTGYVKLEISNNKLLIKEVKGHKKI